VTATEFRKRLERRAQKGGTSVPRDLSDRLWGYFELLMRWNQKINLTSLGQPDAAIDRLLLEPLMAVRYIQVPAPMMLDVGSGSGSPAIPLKLALAGSALVMVESKVRKAAFLREAVRHLGLSETRVETARFEELLSRPDLHESRDIITVRAVRIETRVLTTLQAFLRPQGQILLFRGPAGPAGPAPIPPLHWVATYPLVESLRSRLVVIGKQPVGHML
jgi:16S rRNA (guanine527-N7)-methyltransferase